ncbi:hypothetical protein G6514_005138 [Epicoccum nigrum]|nr:hypothetical protein G6514_005138 [Epicoccum nigrum]
MGDNSEKHLWDAIEVAIDRKLVKSEFDRTRREFLPEGELDRILQEISKGEEYGSNLHHVVAALLGIDFPEMTQEEQGLVGYILDKETPALKLLFTVLYIKHHSPYKAMALFKREQINDIDLASILSVEIPAGEVEKHPLFALGGSSSQIWSRNCIKNFQREQKLFQAAVLTTDPKKMPGQFGQKTLPFIQKDQKRSGGAFGIVHKYTIQRNHLDMNREVLQFGNPTEEHVLTGNQNDAGYVVAVKELRKDNGNVARHWAKEVSALSKMNTLDKEHIVRFLTAFTRGDSNNLEYYVVFEWAEGGNLKDLWTHFPDQGRNVPFIKWIMKQLHGLSQALQAAHYLLDDDGIYRGASYRHGDLKPENILWFPWEGSDWGTLKICDWGEAKIHREVTGLRYHTTTQFGTRRYEPPEAVVGESELSEAAKDARSRLYDLWSMGCVMMECTIWLVYDMDELKRFNKSNLEDHSLSEYFYELHIEGNRVRKVVHGAVNRWLRHMRNDPFCRPGETAIGDALEIISKGLLVVQLPTGDIHPQEVTGVRNARSRAVSPPLSPQTSTLHVPEATFSRVQGLTAGASIPSTNPGINITPAEDVSNQVETEELSSEPVRYRATELADRLGDIVNGGRNDRYWLAPGSAAPVPRAFERSSHLSPGSMGTLQPPNARHVATRPKDNGNYAHPELDRDRWTFEVDNGFAANVLPDRNYMQVLSGAGSTAPRLCGRCTDIQKRLWSPLFQQALFWQACVRHEATDWRTIVFERTDSSLKIIGKKSPAISLFRDNVS